jgi:hypothetical protein
MKVAQRFVIYLGVTRASLAMVAVGVIASCSDEEGAHGPPPLSTSGDGGHGGNTADESAAGRGGDLANDAAGDGGEPASVGGDGGAPSLASDDMRNIIATHLELDVATHVARATIELEGSLTSTAATFEVGDLDVRGVEDETGPLAFALRHGERGALLDVQVPPGEGSATLVVDYAFRDHTLFNGWLSALQVSFLWPHHCGNLFPCKSDPAEGLAFTMQVTGYADGMTAVFPRSIPADAPSYMPALAIGDFTELDLGSTTNGTHLSAWYLPNVGGVAKLGTQHLAQVFDFYEQTYGEYAFGETAGSVSVDWGSSGFRGMEHHPYWHINKQSFGDEVVHAHEAAHGWYGNGVRIACWEDLVLSEGTATYLAAHALEQFQVDAWPDYECRLKRVCDPTAGINTIALPDTCGEIDLSNHPLDSAVPYMKGAFFLRQLAETLGPELLDTALAEFYRSHVGQSARMQTLINFIRSKTDINHRPAIDTLAHSWLRQLECPIDLTRLCP